MDEIRESCDAVISEAIPADCVEAESLLEIDALQTDSIALFNSVGIPPLSASQAKKINFFEPGRQFNLCDFFLQNFIYDGLPRMAHAMHVVPIAWRCSLLPMCCWRTFRHGGSATNVLVCLRCLRSSLTGR